MNFHVLKLTYMQGNCVYQSWNLVNVHKLGIIFQVKIFAKLENTCMFSLSVL